MHRLFYIGFDKPDYMALQDRVRNLFSTTNSDEETKIDEFDGWDEPRANEVSIGITGENVDIDRVREVQGSDVFDRIKNSPELISVMQAVVDDIMGGDEPTFIYTGRTGNADNPGKRNIQDAKEFWRNNKELIADSIMDAMAMGDGYLYKMTTDQDEAKSRIDSYVKNNYNFNQKRYQDAASELMFNKVKDNINETKDLELVPASTITHDIDEFGNIEKFEQDIGTDEYHLDPEKVIHHSYLNLDGKTYGFTPVASLFAELDMLANAKDHNGIRFDNAAVANKVFKLPDDGPEGQNFEMVKQTVEKYRKLQNKHRDLVLTGNIEIEDLNDTGDMEFRELSMYITRVLVMAWQVPPSRIGGVMGSEGATESAMAVEGYNKRIRRQQDKYENILNEEIFEPLFSVRIQLPNPHVQTQIRKAERDLRRTEVVKQQIALGMMNKEEAMKYLGKTRQEVAPDLTEEDMREMAQGMAQSSRDSDINTPQADQIVDDQMTPDRNGGNDSTVENQ